MTSLKCSPYKQREQECSRTCAALWQMLMAHGDAIKTHFLPTRLETSCSNTNLKRVCTFKFWMPVNVLPTKPHLVYPQQKRDAKRSKHFLVEMRHCDQHLIFLINVYLVQRYFLGTHFKHRSVKHSVHKKRPCFTSHCSSNEEVRSYFGQNAMFGSFQGAKEVRATI